MMHVVATAGRVAMTPTAVELAHHLLHDSFDDRGLTAAEARDVLQATRKYAVPLREHLARTGFTTFDGTDHRLTSAAGDGGADTRQP